VEVQTVKISKVCRHIPGTKQIYSSPEKDGPLFSPYNYMEENAGCLNKRLFEHIVKV
jgi:hypothetical protein